MHTRISTIKPFHWLMTPLLTLVANSVNTDTKKSGNDSFEGRDRT